MARTIIVVGGGFCGVALAANLLRRTWPTPTRVVLIERDRLLGRGAAYAPRDFPYLLNVPAARMSADTSRPLEFLQFARRRIPDARGEDFLPRALYGDYLAEMLDAAERTAAPDVRLERVRAHVCDLEHDGRHGARPRVFLEDGRTMRADEVVLALGNPPPASIAALAPVADSDRYYANPWRATLPPNERESVLLVGTGLTMADVVLKATGQGAGPTVHALSRHGLLPLPQVVQQSDPCADDARVCPAQIGTARSGLRAFRRLAADVQAGGGHWQQVITLARTKLPALWQKFSDVERRRFLRHARAYWDIHRHRLPPQVHERLRALRAEGRLHVHAGTILQTSPSASGIEVIWRRRGETQPQRLTVDRIVNCTGPDYDPQRSREPLMQSLLRRGLACTDALNLGLQTGPNGMLIDAEGQPDARLFYVGPLLRADRWEVTSVAELRVHVEQLSAHLAALPEISLQKRQRNPECNRFKTTHPLP